MKYLIVSILLLSQPLLFCQSSISRVEPPNWWVGMEHHEIEILIYGTNLADLTPKIQYKGVEIRSHKSYENPNYLFLTIDITEDANPGNLKIDLVKNNNILVTYDFPIYEREEGRRNIEGFTTSDVMYLITPDRFSNGDPSNDNVAGLKEKANRSLLGGREYYLVDRICRDFGHKTGYLPIP